MVAKLLLYSEDTLYICGNQTGECFTGYLSEVNTSEARSAYNEEEVFGHKDAVWVITTSIMVFMIQTGFGLLEAGCVSVKSEINIMMKNALDVVFGGVTYWAFGFAFSFGDSPGTNPFIGVGHFFVSVPEERMGYIYALFLFQLSFATTSTTIVSGAMAERTKLISYNVFSMCMTLIYCIPAHWVWGPNGFLFTLGVQDIAGCGPVHLVGGVTGLVATLLIGPRKSAFDSDERQNLPSPLKAILGMFMLWWGWLRFNSGSVFVVSSSEQWKYAVRAAVNTIVASMGGGIASVTISLLLAKFWKKSRRFPYDIGTIVNGVLGSLVSITAACTLVQPWEAFAIGIVGVILTVVSEMAVSKLKIDDPVGVIPVHAVCSIWGLLAVGLFIPAKESLIAGQGGLFKTGQFYMLGVQLLTAVVIIAWTVLMSLTFLKIIDLTIGLRLDKEHEEIGADVIEHGIGSLPAASDLAADSVLSITGLSDNGMDEDFKVKVNHLFKDFFSSVCRNELYMTVSQQEHGVLALEIRTKDETPSVDSGVIEEVNEQEKEYATEEPDQKSLCCCNHRKPSKQKPKADKAVRNRKIYPNNHQAQSSSNTTSLGINMTRPVSHRPGSHRPVNIIRFHPNATNTGTEVEMMDQDGHHHTQVIQHGARRDEERPGSGFEAAIAAPY